MGFDQQATIDRLLNQGYVKLTDSGLYEYTQSRNSMYPTDPAQGLPLVWPVEPRMVDIFKNRSQQVPDFARLYDVTMVSITPRLWRIIQEGETKYAIMDDQNNKVIRESPTKLSERIVAVGNVYIRPRSI